MNAFGPLPLPTDNLYKFYALTGLAIFLFSLYVGWQFSEDLHRRMNAASLAVNKAKIEADYLTRLTDRLGQIANDAKANLSDEDTRKQGKVLLHISEEDLRKMIERRDELLRDVRLKLAEVDSAEKEVEKAGATIDLVGWGSIFLLIFGSVLMWYGFRKWHVLQEMQDNVLKGQLAEVQSESSAKSALPRVQSERSR